MNEKRHVDARATVHECYLKILAGTISLSANYTRNNGSTRDERAAQGAGRSFVLWKFRAIFRYIRILRIFTCIRDAYEGKSNVYAFLRAISDKFTNNKKTSSPARSINSTYRNADQGQHANRYDRTETEEYSTFASGRLVGSISTKFSGHRVVVAITVAGTAVGGHADDETLLSRSVAATAAVWCSARRCQTWFLQRLCRHS